MPRDFQWKHETMPSETDREFVEMVATAISGVDGRCHWSSAWSSRLVEIARRGLDAVPAEGSDFTVEMVAVAIRGAAHKTRLPRLVDIARRALGGNHG